MWGINKPVTQYERRLFAKELETRYIASSVKEDKVFDLGDPIVAVRDAMAAIVDDSFTECFDSAPVIKFNFTWYLWPMYMLGVGVRYGILFPVRLVVLLACWLFFTIFFSLTWLLKNPRRGRWQRALIRMLCYGHMLSWSAAIRFHGVIPPRKGAQVYVANHTSMIDMVILGSAQSFSVVGQKHPGFVGIVQSKILACLGSIWFQRNETRDRKKVTKRIRQHVHDPDSLPLLVFPEGTCVGPNHCVMFKRGAFELDAEVVPVAILYNRYFAEAYHNSREIGFIHHLFRLMTSWCVAADVWIMNPMTRRENEEPIDFANRVKAKICAKAGLKNVDIDGYAKYFQVSPKFRIARQKQFAANLLRRLNAPPRSTPLSALPKFTPDSSDDAEALRHAAETRNRRLSQASSDDDLPGTPASDVEGTMFAASSVARTAAGNRARSRDRRKTSLGHDSE